MINPDMLNELGFDVMDSLLKSKQYSDLDKVYTILAIKYLMEQKEKSLYGKLLIPLAGGQTKDPYIEKQTIKLESYYREILDSIEVE